MTFDSIVKQYAEAVYNTGVVSRCMGLAQVSNVATAGTTQTIVTGEVYPFNTGRRETISPDSKESGISFFRASAMQITKQSAFLSEMRNTLTLTVWINGEKVKSNGEQDIQMMLASTLKRFQPVIDSQSSFRRVSLDTNEYASEGVQAYGWDGLKFKYNEAPHMLFNIQFQFQAWVSAGCSTPTYNVISPVC